MRGCFITLYGINNIGKTTQAKRLVQKLKKAGYQAKYLKYPIYDLQPSGGVINTVLRSKKQRISEDELQMWYTINRYQYQNILKKYLEKGYIIVAEDYTGTGLAWGAAKGADLSWLKQINAYLVKEDISILLDGERFIWAKEKKHVHETNDALMKKCRIVHKELAREFSWNMVEVKGGIAEVHNKIWDIVKKKLPRCKKR